GIECDADQSGWIQPAHSQAALEKTRSRAEQWARRGRATVTLDRQETEDLTGIRGYPGGWMDPSGGVLNPVEYARGLADAAEKAGARIFEHTRVASIDRNGDGWALKTESGSVCAGKVLIATNAYGGPLN
ncbi:MAG: FAD-binding oxidoreductase, partial [Mesorhizobium sp.]